MNSTRRGQLRSLFDRIDALQNDVIAIKDDEAEALRALPESFADSKQATAMADAIEQLEESIDALGEALDYLREATK